MNGASSNPFAPTRPPSKSRATAFGTFLAFAAVAWAVAHLLARRSRRHNRELMAEDPHASPKKSAMNRLDAISARTTTTSRKRPEVPPAVSSHGAIVTPVSSGAAGANAEPAPIMGTDADEGEGHRDAISARPIATSRQRPEVPPAVSPHAATVTPVSSGATGANADPAPIMGTDADDREGHRDAISARPIASSRQRPELPPDVSPHGTIGTPVSSGAAGANADPAPSPTMGIDPEDREGHRNDPMIAVIGQGPPRGRHGQSLGAVPESAVKVGTGRDGLAIVRVLDMVATDPTGHRDAAPIGRRRKRIEADAIRVGATVVSGHLARAIAQIPGAAIGDEHEFVHRLRVACRRTRVALELWTGPLGQVLGDGEVKRARRGLRDLARSVGAVRDLDVWLLDLVALSERAGVTSGVAVLRDRASDERRIANDAFRNHLTSPEVAWLCDELPLSVKAAIGERLPDDAVLIRARQRHGCLAIVRVVRDLNRAGRPLSEWVDQRDPHDEPARIASFPSAPAHEIRLYAKRARYTAEAFVPAFKDAPEALDATITSLARIQEKIGDWHDRVGWHERIVSEAKLISTKPNAGDDLVGLMKLASQVGRERDHGLEKIASAWRDRPRVSALRDALAIRT